MSKDKEMQKLRALLISGANSCFWIGRIILITKTHILNNLTCYFHIILIKILSIVS